MTILAASPNVKHTGAYYTSEDVARFLADWAIRSPDDEVLDPSFGGGVFLEAAARVLEERGGRASQVYGVEFDATVREDTAQRLQGVIPEKGLWISDFFALDPRSFDAVIGNPPFVRYQTFSGSARERAMYRSLQQGVTLPRLASSWAPFVVHSCAMLRPGGRLAMVLPMEMWHAAYARPVLAYLTGRFRTLEVLTFDDRLFPDLSQDTVLVLADDFGQGDAELRWHHTRSAADLSGWTNIRTRPPARVLPADLIATGEQRLIEEFVPKAARELYRELAAHPKVVKLGNIARVGIGYVSGNNKFFHLSEAEASEKGIPREYLVQAIRKGRAFRGLRFTQADWEQAELRGDAAFLLSIPAMKSLPELPGPLQDYIAQGERDGVHLAYKCKVRDPWYSVPHVHIPDGFVTYMSGLTPKFVVNAGEFVSPNNLHTVRLHRPEPTLADRCAAGWRSSLSRLSVEIEGHAMGGGMLKLEPKEAASVLLPLPDEHAADFSTIDALARTSTDQSTSEEIDRETLMPLGVSRRDCRLLRNAAEGMAERRYRGGRD